MNRPTVLCKIVGVYQIGYHNRVTGKRSMEQVAVMQVSFIQLNTINRCPQAWNHDIQKSDIVKLIFLFVFAEHILQQENNKDF